MWKAIGKALAKALVWVAGNETAKAIVIDVIKAKVTKE